MADPDDIIDDDKIKDDLEDEDTGDEPVDVLDLSDEDFMKLEEPQGIEEEEKKPEDEVNKKDEEDDLDLKEPDPSDKSVTDKEDDIDPDKDKDPLKKDDESLKDDKSSDSKVDVDDSDKTDLKPDKEDDKEKPKADESKIDYEAEYKKITAPFKANGGEMAAKNSEDAVRLMQMGANYHKKMAGLKPSMRILKLLDKNNLMDENDLNFLIDLHNKNPEAITKLVKDSGIDPLDVDVKNESKYVPTKHTVNESELVLDAVLDDIKSTPTYTDTMEIITNVWDQESRTLIAGQPEIIQSINEHVADGTYDKIMSQVTYERSLGKLSGVSDVQAYKQMGDALYAAGKIGQKAAPDADVAPVIPKTKIDSEEEVKRKKRKKAVSPTKNVGTPATVSYSPLSLSDDDFAKIDPTKFNAK